MNVVRSPRLTLISVALLASCAVACKGKKRDEVALRRAAAERVEGLDALPADVRVVVGANVARLRDSALVKRAFTRMLARDPGVAERLVALQKRCNLDPSRDLETVVVGLMGTTSARDVVLVATGRFDEKAIAGCVEGSLSDGGGSLERKQQGDVTVYVAHNPRGSGDIAFSFGAPGTLVIADSEALLHRARDPGAPKLRGDEAMMKLLAATDTRAGLWGAGRMAPEVGKGLVAAAGVDAPATAIWGHVDLGAGLRAELSVEMESRGDADKLLGVVQQQIASYGAVAQVYALGPMVNKIKPETRDKVFVVSLSLSAGEVAKLEEVLGERTAPADGKKSVEKKEGAL